MHDRKLQSSESLMRKTSSTNIIITRKAGKLLLVTDAR